MNDSTYISKLPVNELHNKKSQKPELSANTYIPMNAHANPYTFNTDNRNVDGVDGDDIDVDSMQRLPSRDIPSNTAEYIQDEEVLVNYIEEPKSMTDYIQDYKEEESERIREYNREKNIKITSEKFVSDFQEVFFVGLLYFLFQMPITTILLRKYFNILGFFGIDGNLTLRGIAFKSVAFSSVYFMVFQFICNACR